MKTQLGRKIREAVKVPKRSAFDSWNNDCLDSPLYKRFRKRATSKTLRRIGNAKIRKEIQEI